MATIGQTHYPRPGPEFNPSNFSALLADKGRFVRIETALVCPCKEPTGGFNPACRHCLGSGWVFANPREAKILLTAQGKQEQLETWTLDLKGTIQFSAEHDLKLGRMDKLTLLDSYTWTSEVVEVKYVDGIYKANVQYLVEDLECFLLFTGLTSAFAELTSAVTVTGSVLSLTTLPGWTADEPVTATVRYLHRPVYHILDFRREAMESWENGQVTRLPLAGMAQKASYITTDRGLGPIGLTTTYTSYAQPY